MLTASLFSHWPGWWAVSGAGSWPWCPPPKCGVWARPMCPGVSPPARAPGTSPGGAAGHTARPANWWRASPGVNWDILDTDNIWLMLFGYSTDIRLNFNTISWWHLLSVDPCWENEAWWDKFWKNKIYWGMLLRIIFLRIRLTGHEIETIHLCSLWRLAEIKGLERQNLGGKFGQ